MLFRSIRPWPIKGLYMPDAIASYKVGSKTFLVTANENGEFDYSVVTTQKSTIDDAKFAELAQWPTSPRFDATGQKTAKARATVLLRHALLVQHLEIHRREHHRREAGAGDGA